MKCSKCEKTAHLAIINKYGEFDEDNVFCCWCFVKDYKEKMFAALGLKEAQKN